MKKEFDIKSLLLALLVNVLAICLLILMCIDLPERMGESGVPVMMGNVQDPSADFDFTPVEALQVPSSSSDAASASTSQAEPVITQNLEETVAIEEGSEKTQDGQALELTEEELRAREEQLEREKTQAIASSMNSLFARSSTMQATQGQSEAEGADRAAGSPDGNAVQGKLTGRGANGVVDMGGRDLDGILPIPSNKGISEQAAVVVNITVSPDGRVISATINKRTSTANQDLRDRAVNAARQARFKPVPSPENKTGTITYFFVLQ